MLLEKIANIMLVNGNNSTSSEFTLGQSSIHENSITYTSKSIEQHTPRKFVANRLEKDAIKIFN